MVDLGTHIVGECEAGVLLRNCFMLPVDFRIVEHEEAHGGNGLVRIIAPACL